MPGVRGPSDYSQEPSRHPSLRINAKEPFNAEPPRSALIYSYVTPVEFFYKRNHGPIPIVDDIERYSVSITGLIAKPKELFMKDVWKLPKYNVAATLQCAGNRRTAMSKTRTVKGVGWDVAAIGNDLFLFSHQLTSKSSSVTSQKLSIIFIVPSLEDPNQSDSQEYAGLNKCGSDSPCAHTMCTPDVQGMPSLKLADTSNWAIPNMSATA